MFPVGYSLLATCGILHSVLCSCIVCLSPDSADRKTSRRQSQRRCCVRLPAANKSPEQADWHVGAWGSKEHKIWQIQYQHIFGKIWFFLQIFERFCDLGWIRNDIVLLIAIHALQFWRFLTFPLFGENVSWMLAFGLVNEVYGGMRVYTNAWRMHMKAYGYIWMHTGILVGWYNGYSIICCYNLVYI